MPRATGLLVAWAAALCGPSAGCSEEEATHAMKVIVLGFDGLDPALCEELMAAGRLPHLSALARRGSFKRLGTSVPPQSPVAWSNLMTGTDSGQHGVFDFIHRDPTTAAPFSSAAVEVPPEPLPIVGSRVDSVPAFGYELPVRPTTIKPNRHSRAFWEYLTEAGVPAHVFRMPANYPPTASAGAHFCCLSDMGTVDVVNSQGGTFSYYTSDPAEQESGLTTEGGVLYGVTVHDDRVDGQWTGPVNEYVAGAGSPEPVRVAFVLRRDPSEDVVTVEWQDQTVLLREGEWSEWRPVTFELVPYVTTLRAMVRLYMKEVHPQVKLYVSPFNMDPQEESWEIDRPKNWSRHVSDAIGRYYTQGLAENTKALSNRIFTRDEFLRQSEIVFQERLRLFDFAMGHYRGGLLFFYFGTTDLVGHMFWGAQRAGHPGVTDEEHQRYGQVMAELYERVDEIVGRAVERFPDALLMVVSDHGFCDYRRSVHLNTWLQQNGYAVMNNPPDRKASMNFDFLQTRAYGVGLNGLYINLAGRERMGVVDSAYRQSVIDEITAKLLAFRDPKSGGAVVKTVYDGRRQYHGPLRDAGPDLIVGYMAGYRGSGESAMGAFPKAVIEDNTDAWGADHCVAADQVPGVLFSSERVRVDEPDLLDIAPTLLARFGVAAPGQMTGRDFLGGSLALSIDEHRKTEMASVGPLRGNQGNTMPDGVKCYGHED
ncbi:MAG: hypothetical protein HOP29_00600 [Phycisphaerales bacterium]|nr:hypothetical protein [Phycisphaerales bacterium]